jgi:site-specific DNA-methyltransferase (adenine-specific)
MSFNTYDIDCMKGMRHYPDQYFDLAIPDVPYGINVGKMGFMQARNGKAPQKSGKNLIVAKKGYSVKDWDKVVPKQEYFDELRRISRHQIIWGANYVNWEGMGPGRIKWDKCVAEGVSFNPYEYAYCSMIDYEMEITLLWSGMQQAKSLREPTVQQGNKSKNEKRIHPCQKPVLLYQKLFVEFAQAGWKVIDTHVGSGSSRIAAHQFGFSEYVGFEADPEHFKDQEKRWSNYIRQIKMF